MCSVVVFLAASAFLSLAFRLQPTRLPVPSDTLCASCSQSIQSSVSSYFPDFPPADVGPLLKRPFLLSPSQILSAPEDPPALTSCVTLATSPACDLLS